jgi:prepilin-type N-terminal cleavage/methylation domain-containing protein
MRGFTFVELMVVITIIVILVTMAIPIYSNTIKRSKESVLKQNLFTLRTVIDNYTYDKQKAPQALQDLVREGYLRDVPIGSADRQQQLADHHGGCGAKRQPVRAGNLRRAEQFRQELTRRDALLGVVSARIQALALLPVFLTGCGYVGDPHPPLANIPSKVQDLAAVQRGSRIIVQFTVPSGPPRHALEGTAAGRSAGRGRGPALRFPPRGRHRRARFRKRRSLTRFPAGDWVGKEVAIAVNVIGVNGKESGWGNFVNVPVVPEPPQPHRAKS